MQRQALGEREVEEPPPGDQLPEGCFNIPMERAVLLSFLSWQG